MEGKKISESTSNENEEFNVTVYPNPSNGLVTVSFDQSLSQLGNLEILSISGQLLESRNIEPSRQFVQLELSHLPDGIYILRLGGDETSYTKLFSISR